MSVSRIKTLVVAALVLVNVFFLVLIISDTVADARSERQATQDVCSVLQAGGIIIDPDDVRADNSLRPMKTARGNEAEATIAQAVLGSTETTVRGVIYEYENARNGIAVFYSGGDFEIYINPGVITSSGGTVRVVQRLLRDMNISTSEIVSAGEPGSEVVTALSAYKGVGILNCAIEFVFSDGSLETIKGRYVTGLEPVDDSTGMSRVSTALLGFLAAVRSEEREDVVCTRILNVETCYRHHVVGSFGEGVIMPVWLITTDSGRYVIDDISGDIQLVQ